MYSCNMCKRVNIQAKQQVHCMQADMVQYIMVTNATYRSKETQRWQAFRGEIEGRC